MWDDEEDRDVVNELCVSLSGTLMTVGPSLITPTCSSPCALFLH